MDETIFYLKFLEYRISQVEFKYFNTIIFFESTQIVYINFGLWSEAHFFKFGFELFTHN